MVRTFAGQVAVVTGASSGIGWELAKQLAAAGAKVGVIARRQEHLDRLVAEIRASGGTAHAAVADVAEEKQVRDAVAAIRTTLGPIDVMIANAGVGAPTARDPVNVADVESMVRVNVLGMVYAFAAVMPEMLASKSGRLAAVSSLAGYSGLPGESAYCASKAAMNVYLDGLRAHLRGTGVSVTTLCPGFVRTAMTESNTFWMPGLMNADDAARRILKAVARGDAVYNFPWMTARLMKLLSWMPDRFKVWLMADYNSTTESAGSSSVPAAPSPGPGAGGGSGTRSANGP